MYLSVHIFLPNHQSSHPPIPSTASAWIAMSVGLAQMLDHHLNPLCREYVILATISISQAVKFSVPRVIRISRLDTLVKICLPKLQSLISSYSSKLHRRYHHYTHRSRATHSLSHSLSHPLSHSFSTSNSAALERSSSSASLSARRGLGLHPTRSSIRLSEEEGGGGGGGRGGGGASAEEECERIPLEGRRELLSLSRSHSLAAMDRERAARPTALGHPNPNPNRKEEDYEIGRTHSSTIITKLLQRASHRKRHR